jgi:GNAT superfamily N-acetyltransferase
MNQDNSSSLPIKFHPLTPDRWADFEQLFGERGACGGCWCLWWKLNRSDFNRQKGDGNRQAQKTLVESGTVPGILAYADGKPVGWCAVEPREVYSGLARSRILKPVDDQPVWSVVCFFVEKNWRKKGITVQLLEAAIEHVWKQNGKIVEGYPVEPKKDKMPPVFAYTGLSSAFKKAGFVECERRSETRPIMRCHVSQQ